MVAIPHQNKLAATSHRAMLFHSRRRISAPQLSRPVPSQVRQSCFGHSHRGLLWTSGIYATPATSGGFRSLCGDYGGCLPSSAGFTPPGSTARTHAAVSMGAFRGVTPSFDSSEYQFSCGPQAAMLPLFTVKRVALRNVSHEL
jgi:hypothetical protein